MSQQGRSGSDSALHYPAGASSPPRYTHTSDSTPRYMPSTAYQPITTHDGPASSGTGHMSHYQSSSSHRGRVTNTDYYCLVVYTTWICGHETSETRRHRLCWKCNDLDESFCRPEPVEIDKSSECASCRACREEERRRRDQARAAARVRERDRDRIRERSPRSASTWQRRSH
jgi:hypothetical protein